MHHRSHQPKTKEEVLGDDLGMDVQLQSLGPPTVTLPIVTTPTMVEYSAVDLSKLNDEVSPYTRGAVPL